MERIRFTFTLMFLIGAIGIAAVFIPTAFGRVRDAQRNIALAESRLTRQKDIAAAFDALRETIAQNVDTVKLNEALPSEDAHETDVPDTITILERLAEQQAAGIFLQSVKVGDAVALTEQFSPEGSQGGTIRVREIDIQGIGSYESIQRFLEAIRFSLRLFEPISLAFNVESPDDVVPFQLMLQTFLHTPCADAAQCEMTFPAAVTSDSVSSDTSVFQGDEGL